MTASQTILKEFDKTRKTRKNTPVALALRSRKASLPVVSDRQ